MIVTVTLNPALHVQYEATRVELGAANSVSRARYRTGGRGLAVARLLHTFGHEVVAAGLAGGSAGELIRNELSRADHSRAGRSWRPGISRARICRCRIWRRRIWRRRI